MRHNNRPAPDGLHLSPRVVVSVVVVAAVALAAVLDGSAGRGGGTLPGTHSRASIAGLYGSLPPTGTPTKGGTISFGQLDGSTPTDILPIIPTADSSVFAAAEFINQMWLPLYNGPDGTVQKIDYGISLASAPVLSDHDKVVTIHMKKGYRWSNGQPVDANDLIFFIDLVKQAVRLNAANWSAYSPGLIPDCIASITAPSRYTVVMHLTKAFNPGYLLNFALEGNIYPLPSRAWNIAASGGPHLNWRIPANARKIYEYLSKQGSSVAAFGTNPLWKVADGPFVIRSFNQTNSSYTLTVNQDFGGSPKPAISKWSVETFTGVTPMLNALRTGSLDIGQLDYSQLGQVGALRAAGYSVFGYPSLGWYAAIYNFKDTAGHFNSIISQLYVRQALAMLDDQQAMVTGFLRGAGGVSYGPVPKVPPTPYTPYDAVHAPYPYDPAEAVALLKEHGWKVVPNGQTTCMNAGAGAGECGAGIPAGTALRFNWFYATMSPSFALESEAFASEAKQAAGISIALTGKTINFLTSNYTDSSPTGAQYIDDWAINDFGGFTDDYYPTQATIFNTGGDFNLGGYSDPTADRLINASVYGSDPRAVTNEASYLTRNPPALFFPNPDLIWAVSNKIGGPARSFVELTQNYDVQPQFYYLSKNRSR